MELVQETEIFERLLQAREQRQQQKLYMVEKGYHLVSLQLNIPGFLKSNSLLTAFIKHVDAAFSRYVTSLNANNSWNEKHEISDAAGDSIIYLFAQSKNEASELKQITEAFEQEFELGRIVDLDVLDANGFPISSGKAKPCFVCEHPAEDCRKTKRHTIAEVRQSMEKAIAEYLEREQTKLIVTKVASFAVQGLLHEVALSPKPGLVCRHSSGAHSDMDFSSFVNSTAAIAPYFLQINELAVGFEGKDVSVALPQIKNIGLQMEQSMMAATNGVNTHKGAIFLMGLSCFAVVRVVRQLGYLKLNALSSTIQQLTRGLVQRELCAADEQQELTHGQQCFLKYGLQAAGARGEAEQGMPTVLHHALPYLNSKVAKRLSQYSDDELKHLLIPVLLKIISVNNDTNVIYRHDALILEQLKQRAQKALRDWECNRQQTYEDLVDWCRKMKISPGGSADLLAVTLTLHLCQTEFTKDSND